ncbi:MAG: metallophosphoesterase, partial [Pseudomonadota bacterium]
MQDQSHTPTAPASTAPHDRPHSVTRLVHLSDIHLAPLPPFPWRHWNLKRALGYANWRLKRRFVHTRDALDLMTAHIAEREKDHILVGGDLCNIGLPLEYALGLRFLLELGSASEVAVVPGNHDIYTRLLTDPGVGRWQAFMTGDRAWDAFDAEQRLGPTFPYVRQIGQVAVIGVNTAVPTPPGSAYGRVGARQLADLRRVLDRAGEQGLFRLILMHHP